LVLAFLEPIFEHALAIELHLCGIEFTQQPAIALDSLGQSGRLDLIFLWVVF
jgi:hypothetical protein